MSEDRDHSEELQRYLSGEMTQAEAHAFEKLAMVDPFLYEAIEGAEQLDATTFASDVEGLKVQLEPRKTKPIFTVWRVAAAITLLIVGGFSVSYLLEDVRTPELAQEVKTDSSEISQAERADSNEDIQIQADELQAEERSDQMSSAGQPPKPKTKIPRPVAVLKEETNEQSIVPEITSDKNTDQMWADQVAGLSIEEPEEESGDAMGYAEATEPDVDPTADTAKSRRVKKSSINHSRSFLRTRSEDLVEKAKGETNQITGTVTDESGEGLPGVNVVVKGTTTGVTTDLDGAFEIEASDEDELSFSSVGMASQELVVGSRSELDVQMQFDSQALQEVVVTGYGVFDNEQEGYDSPRPVSGWKEFDEYIEESLFYPEEAIGRGIEGRVVLQLTISRVGQIKEIEIKKSLGSGCDEEAIRLIEEGPNWRAASRDGISVESKLRVRVKFEMKD